MAESAETVLDADEGSALLRDALAARRAGSTPGGQEPPPPGQAPNQQPSGDGGGQEPPSGGETPEERARRANREAQGLRERLRAAEGRITEFEQRDMSETDRLRAQVSAAEARATEAEGQLLRYEIGAARGLRPEAYKYLRGSTREELESSADELKTMFGGGQAPPAPDFGAGTRPPSGNGDGDGEDFNSILRRSYAGRQ